MEKLQWAVGLCVDGNAAEASDSFEAQVAIRRLAFRDQLKDGRKLFYYFFWKMFINC